jgi:hypothetical protein
MTREELQAQIYSAAQAEAALGVKPWCMYNWRQNGTLVPLVATRNCNVYARADVEALLAARGGRITAGRPTWKAVAT